MTTLRAVLGLIIVISPVFGGRRPFLLTYSIDFSLKKYLLGTNSAPGPVLGAGNTVMSEATFPLSGNLGFSGRDRHNQSNSYMLGELGRKIRQDKGIMNTGDVF